MRNRSVPSAGPVSAMQLVGLVVTGGLQLLSRQDRRVLVGCSLLILGLAVLGSKARA